jgi:hypothetical protein
MRHEGGIFWPSKESALLTTKECRSLPVEPLSFQAHHFQNWNHSNIHERERLEKRPIRLPREHQAGDIQSRKYLKETESPLNSASITAHWAMTRTKWSVKWYTESESLRYPRMAIPRELFCCFFLIAFLSQSRSVGCKYFELTPSSFAASMSDNTRKTNEDFTKNQHVVVSKNSDSWWIFHRLASGAAVHAFLHVEGSLSAWRLHSLSSFAWGWLMACVLSRERYVRASHPTESIHHQA